MKLINSVRPDFEVCDWVPFGRPELVEVLNRDGWKLFRVGKCDGQWRATDDAYEILSIINKFKGNGDFDHALDWFEDSCRRDKKALRIREVWDKRLMAHLIEKRGFVVDHGEDLIKHFTVSVPLGTGERRGR